MPNSQFLEKKLSWLSFNHRVLQEAQDESVPLLERFRFLGIYSSNMDKFYRVRVANVRRKVLFSPNKKQKKSALTLFDNIQLKLSHFNISLMKLISYYYENLAKIILI